MRDLWALLQELKQNSELKGYFEEWQSRITSVFSSGDFTQFFQQTGDLFTSMKDTDEFLSLASELVDLIKIVVAEATEKVIISPFPLFSPPRFPHPSLLSSFFTTFNLHVFRW